MRVYLELNDQASERFWEITVEGTSHIIRYGRIGSAGQSRAKEFESAAKALRDAQSLIASKRQMGYRDVVARAIAVTPVEPEVLGYEPISEEQRALFTRELIGEETLKFWSDEMPMLLEGLELTGADCPPREDMAVLAQEMETIASWTCPDMQREVQRDGDGLAQRVVYSVNGVPILWLCSGAWNDMGTRRSCIPAMFFGGDESRGEFHLFGHRFVEDFRLVLTRLTRFCAERLPLLRGKRQRTVQDRKIKQVAEANIPMVVENLLAGTGYEYSLKEEAKASVLRIKLGHERDIELNLPHKSFVQRTGDILPTVARVEQLLEALPLPVVLGSKTYDRQADWGEVWYSQGPQVDSFPELFWQARLEAYLMETLFHGNPPKLKQKAPLAEIMAWEFDGLEKDLTTLGQVQYLIGGREVFWVDGDGLNFDLCTDPEPQGMDIWDLADDGNMPPLANWRAFLAGFVPFYRAQLELEPAARLEFEQSVQMQRRGAEELEASVRARFGGGEREWALDLNGTHRNPPGHHLHLKVRGRKTLTLILDHLDVASTLGRIDPTIALVEETIADCKIPFNLFFPLDWGWQSGPSYQL